MKINEDVLCILTHEKESNRIEIGYVKVEKDLEIEFNGLVNMFEREHFQAKDLIKHIINHKKLNILFSNYDYCSQLRSPFQGFYSTLETIQANYPSSFNGIYDIEKKKEMLAAEKDRLLIECKERLLANYLEKAYLKCQNDKKILAYSHRRVGWSTPKYSLNDNFSVEIKTNFGYGVVSYFYSKIRFKELDIIPYSEWVDYQYSQIYEIVRYSAKHPLSNESWQESMSFISEACNLSLTDEEKFIQKYIIEQCDEMIKGLEKILSDDSFHLKKYNLLNHERGYIDLKLKGHNLIEYRGEKISGALQFVTPIKQFANIFEIEGFVERIEKCNFIVKPMLEAEKFIIINELNQLDINKNILEPVFKELKIESEKYEQKRIALKQLLTIEAKFLSISEFEKIFLEENPNYNKFKEDLNKMTIEFNTIIAEISRLEKILENLNKYQSAIEEYFK